MNRVRTQYNNPETIDSVDARKHLESASTLHWFHWAIVLGSLILTFFAWSYSASQKNKRVEAQFEREAGQVIDLVRERMKKYEDALWSGVALIRTSGGDIDFDHWEQYADSIHIQEKYPGINGFGVIHSVSESELAGYLSDQQSQRPEYHIHPAHNRSHYLPISYVVPVEGNEKAIGLDMAHETNRFTAALKSRDSGQSHITGPITLVQDNGKTPGFLFFAPFYSTGKRSSVEERKDTFSGLVYAPFVVNKLMEGTLEKTKRNVGIRIFDADEMLYDEHLVSEVDYDPNPLFTHSENIELYGRTWKFDIWSAKSFREASSDSQPMTILLGGIIIDALLVLLFISISQSSHKALRYADLMTQQLEKNASVLQEKTIELENSNANLSRFNRAATGREMQMLDLKHEVNELLEEAGMPVRYGRAKDDVEQIRADSSLATVERE